MPISRREFVSRATLGAAAFAVDPAPGQEGRAPRRAAVIGHTGRGDYGHGMELVFGGRPDIELAGLADPDPAGRGAALIRTGALRAYAEYGEMLEKERPAWVSIAMRHADQHHRIGMDCLRAGAHCYFEKPFTRSPDEADELLAEAARRKLCVAVAHTMRMAPVTVRLKRAVEDGLIGELREMRAYGKQDARAGGEDLMVLGSHLFDLMRMFAGDPHSVTAGILVGGRGITREDRRQVKDNVGWIAGDHVFAAFAFAGGIHATFTSDARLRETVGHWGIEFHGSRGVVRLNCDIEPRAFVRKRAGWSEAGRRDEWAPMEPLLPGKAPVAYPSAVDDWLEAADAARTPVCSALNGAWAVEMVAGVYRAAMGGGRVRFPLVDRAHPLS